MNSYSKLTKESLSEFSSGKKCCDRIFNDLIKLSEFSLSEERIDVIQRSAAHFKCDHCFGAFLRAIFVFYGNVTDPSKQYHLELSFSNEEEKNLLHWILLSNNFQMNEIKRKERYVLYIKSSTKIEDFFVLIGANSSVFDLMNSKIEKELLRDINRQTNCDMANIKSSLNSSKKYIEAIGYLNETGKIAGLSEDLKVTAELRMSHNDVSLRELALLHNPPISKPGVKHRLDKILDFYNNIVKK